MLEQLDISTSGLEGHYIDVIVCLNVRAAQCQPVLQHVRVDVDAHVHVLVAVLQ